MKRTRELIEILGTEDYLKLLGLVEQQWRKLITDTASDDFQHQLHQLKSMSYAAGLDDVGDKIRNIEAMLTKGAMQTAHANLLALPSMFEQYIAEAHSVVKQYKTASDSR